MVTLAFLTLATRVGDLSRSFWGDEAWVARCVLGDSVATLAGTTQPTPIGYLILTRAVVSLFGASEASFRILPLLAGVLAVGFMVFLGTQLFSRPLGLLGGLLLALSASAAQYAKEGKQYSIELLVSILLLLFLAQARAPTTWRSHLLRFSAFAFAALFSLPSLVFLPAAFACDFLLREKPIPGRRIALGFGLILAAGLPLAFFVRTLPGLATLRNAWSGAFPDWSAGLENVALVYATLLKTFALTYLYPGFTAHHPGRLFIYLLLAAGFATLLAALLRHRELPLRRAAILSLMPLSGALAAGLLGVYPFGVERLSLYLLPCLLLILLAGVSALPIPEPWLTPGVAIAAVACVPLSLLPIAWAPRVVEDSRGAFREISSQAVRGELLYVDNGLKQPLLVYTQWFPSADPKVQYGPDTMLCCPAAVSRQAHTQSERQREVQSFELFLASGTGRRIWLLHLTRLSHWQFLGWNNLQLHHQILEQRRCQEELERNRPGVTYSAWHCPL